MTHLCVPIFVIDNDQTLRDIAIAAEAGADLAELRIDGFDGDACHVVDHSILSKIVTFRAGSEGGRSEDSPQDRADTLLFLGHLSEYIDFELDSLRNVRFQKE